MNKRHYEHTLPNIRGSLSNTYSEKGKTVYVFRKIQLIKVIKPKKLES